MTATTCRSRTQPNAVAADKAASGIANEPKGAGNNQKSVLILAAISLQLVVEEVDRQARRRWWPNKAGFTGDLDDALERYATFGSKGLLRVETTDASPIAIAAQHSYLRILRRPAAQ